MNFYLYDCGMEQEDYLETIYNLDQELGYVRISDIARALELSKPSVTQMMKKLDKEGCVKYKAYCPLQLTAKGRTIGKKVAERHEVLAEFFTILGIPEKTQEQDIHGIEHYLSPMTLAKLKEVNEFLKERGFGK